MGCKIGVHLARSTRIKFFTNCAPEFSIFNATPPFPFPSAQIETHKTGVSHFHSLLSVSACGSLKHRVTRYSREVNSYEIFPFVLSTLVSRGRRRIEIEIEGTVIERYTIRARCRYAERYAPRAAKRKWVRARYRARILHTANRRHRLRVGAEIFRSKKTRSFPFTGAHVAPMAAAFFRQLIQQPG